MVSTRLTTPHMMQAAAQKPPLAHQAGEGEVSFSGTMDSQVAAKVVGNLVPQTKHSSKFRSAVASSQSGNSHTLNMFAGTLD